MLSFCRCSCHNPRPPPPTLKPPDARTTITALSAQGPSALARPNTANASGVALTIGGYTNTGSAIAAFCCSSTPSCSSGFTALAGAPGHWDLDGSKASGQEAWTLEAGPDGVRDVYCWLRDDAGAMSEVKHIQVLLDTQPPGEPTVPFNNCTSAATGNATLSASVEELGTHIGICCSSDPDFQADCAGRVMWVAGPTQDTAGYPLGVGAPRLFVAECPFQVAPAGMLAEDGSTRIVDIFLVDSAGNVAFYMTPLEVDTTPPTGTLVVNGGAAKTNSSQLALAITAADGHGVARMCVTEDKAACGAASTWRPFEAAIQHPVAPRYADGANQTVYVYLQDRCGVRTPQPLSASIVLDNAVPRALSVQLMTAGNDAYCTSEAKLPILIHAKDGGEGPMSACVTDSLTACAAWEDIGSGDVTYTYTYTLPGTAGSKWVTVWLADEPGGRGNCGVVSDNYLSLDPKPPSGGVLRLNDGAALTSDLSVSAAITGADGGVSSIAQFCFTTNPGNCTKWQSTGDHATPFKLPDSADNTTHTVYAYLKSGCGATTPVPLSANITYSTKHPAAPAVEVIQGGIKAPVVVPLAGVELAITLPPLAGGYTPEM